jgi:DNA-binding MarR family transcriptional regulator
MGANQRSQQWQVVHHIYDAYDRNPGVSFPNVSDLGRAAGLSAPAARRLIDRCVREQLAYLFASAADPCVGLTDAGRAFARDERRGA